MPIRGSFRYLDFTLEELGRSRIGVDVEVTGWFEPGEEEVRYYPDGSGYPGSPDSFEIEIVTVVRAWGETWEYSRRERPDWFEFLDFCIDISDEDCLRSIWNA